MKRLWTLALSLALAATLGGNALASASAELIRTFVYGDTLYTYVDIAGNTAPITKAEAGIGGQTFPASGNLETVRQAGSPVLYLLLLDASTSMPGFREDIVAYAEALAQTAGEKTRFLLATFGASFALLDEDLTPEELGPAVEGVSYTQTSSRLLEGISGAIDYLESLPRTGNELRDIVVLSDAVEYDADGSVSYDDLLGRLTASDAMLHSVGFGGDATAQGSLAGLAEASGGRHWAVGDDLDAAAAAEELADSNESLYVTSFQFAGYRGGETEQQVSVTFASGAELVCRAVANLSLPQAAEDGGEAEKPAREEPAQTLPPSTTAPAAPQTAGAEGEGEETEIPSTVLMAGVGLVVVAAVVLLTVLLTRRGWKKKGTPPVAAPAAAPQETAPSGVYVRLEILRGIYAGKTQEFNLATELIIGRDGTCDICFDDPAISRRNSRVFLAGGVVYVEDLGSHNGTFLNGAPIQMASILRSGDEISMGDTAFCLKF